MEEHEQITPETEWDELRDTEEYLQYKSYFIDDSYETQIYNIVFKELISKILDTLTQRQQEVITMYYGLNGQTSHSLKDIAKKLNVIPADITEIKKDALRSLKLSVSNKILQEIIKNHTESTYSLMDTGKKPYRETPRRLKELTKILIPFLPKADLQEALNDINSLLKATTTPRLKKELLSKLIIKLRRKYSSNDQLISEEELVYHLMHNYLYRSKKRIKQKKQN